jgi:hypothetical protein
LRRITKGRGHLFPYTSEEINILIIKRQCLIDIRNATPNGVDRNHYTKEIMWMQESIQYRLKRMLSHAILMDMKQKYPSMRTRKKEEHLLRPDEKEGIWENPHKIFEKKDLN